MKLLYVANARIPTEKAHGVQIMKMCDAFTQNGAEVELVVPFRVQTAQMRRVKDAWNYYGVEPCFKLRRLPSLDLLWTVRWMPVQYVLFYIQALTFFSCAVVYCLWRSSDVIYTRGWMFVLLWSPVHWLRGRTLVLEEHTFPHRGGWGAWLHLWASRHTDRLVVITHRLKERYVAAGIPAERVLVAPDGVDLARFENLPDRDEARRQVRLPLGKIVVGYVGRFHTLGRSKGLDTLIEAAVLLRGQDTDIVLCFVGGPKESFAALEELARRYGLPADRLFLVDRVPLLKVPLYMRAFDVCAMPFPWTEHYAYYMSPLKMFEYMASRTPIVATDLPSTREILRDEENAVLVTPGEPQALADGMEWVLGNAELATRIGQRARDDVARYTWTERARKIEDFCSSKGR